MFVGIDLTDPFSRACRANDIALVTAPGTATFDLLPWQLGGSLHFAELAAEISRRFPRQEHFLVIDGPQALATPGNCRRHCEALTRTPARTPDLLPELDGKPFAGYVRGSVLLWRELINAGWEVAEELDQIQPGRMAEAFPGDAWRRLSPHRLPSKGTAPGRVARLALLQQLGLTLPADPLPTHDQLDAALCAALGYWSFQGGRAVRFVGEPLRGESQGLREGYILSPAPEPALHLPTGVEAQPSRSTAGPRQPRLTAAPPARSEATEPQLTALGPGEAWVYFAHDSQADQAKTFEIIEAEGVLWRPAVNSAGQAIANLRRVRPGDPIVVVHGRSMLGAFLGTADGETLPRFEDFPPCVAEVPIGSPLRERFQAAGYKQQEVLTVLVLEGVSAIPEGYAVPKQAGRNAIQRAGRPDLVSELVSGQLATPPLPDR